MRLVERHDTGAAQPKIVGQCIARPFDLPGLSGAAQLVGQLKTLCKARRTQRVALGQKPT